MTQIEKTQKAFTTVEKGTIFTKAEYEEFASKFTVRDKKWHNVIECLSRWDLVIQNPTRYGIERIEIFQKVPTSKITTVDVLEMVKNGLSVEEIEKRIYTTVKIVKIKVV